MITGQWRNKKSGLVYEVVGVANCDVVMCPNETVVFRAAGTGNLYTCVVEMWLLRFEYIEPRKSREVPSFGGVLCRPSKMPKVAP